MKKEMKFEKETDPEVIRNIESKSFSENTKGVGFEHKEMLKALFSLLKEGVVKLRVKHKKEKNLWTAEIYFVDSGRVWYSTDSSNDVVNLTDIVLANGYEPEYIEE